MKHIKLHSALFIVVFVVAVYALDRWLHTPCRADDQTPVACATATVNGQVQDLEIPVATGREQQIIRHVGYTVSYNPDWHIPNWVAYELSADEVDGVEERSNQFLPDPQVYGEPVVTSDYAHSGYDRGHMAPAADMKWSEQAMKESFYMTNMCPQNHNLNAGDWKRLEEQVREWAKMYEHVYVCCGPVVYEGATCIGPDSSIVVPQAFFKVLLMQRNHAWYEGGYVMKNAPRDGKWDLSHYALPVDSIETMTQINFFANFPDSIPLHSIY
ncbi:MAG: DNA/RNA non-specific endonuclease [Paludibacteraceae bacterium]|nr:DNA/RNA non-specific endonuclease [Paludibacteraceae bacterium]